MGLQKFEIVLDNPYGAYFPGAVVSGTLIIWLSKPKSFRKIVVSCQGKAEVKWSETRETGSGDNRRTETVNYTSDQKYFDLKQIVHGRDGDETYELPAGQYSYRFQMVLPSAGLPSSFEGQYGHVRYYVKAKIDRPWRTDNETKTMITLNSIVDLNMHPEYLVPEQKTDHKRVCCLCCRSGKITSFAAIARRGYVPGEYVEFSANVDNKSYNTVIVKMKVMESIIYKAQGLQKVESRTLLDACEKCIPPGSAQVWDHEGLVLPPMPPTGLPHCDIIDIDHTLEFEVNPGWFSFDLELPFKIKIGTIPYSERFDMYKRPTAPVWPFNLPGNVDPTPPAGSPYPVPPGGLPAPSAPAGSPYPVAPVGLPAPSAPAFHLPDNPPAYNNVLGGGGFYANFVSTFPTYPDMPPPRYEESAFGTQDVRDESDTKFIPGPIGFVPKYASYHLQEHKEADK